MREISKNMGIMKYLFVMLLLFGNLLYAVMPQVAAGGSHTIALKSDGTLWAWGNNNFGQLGLGDGTKRTTPVQIGSETTWNTIAAGGGGHTIALKNDGTLWAWGNNNFGQLGDGTTTTRSSPVQIGSGTTWSSIAAGYYHTIALKSDGTLWAWGHNAQGRLGNGTITDSTVPVQIGSETMWSAIAAGFTHTIAIKNNGTLWAWGNNGNGQLGDGTTANSTVPVQIGGNTTWSSIAAGDYYTIALKNNGTLWAWGKNSGGQLGVGDTTQHTSPIQIGSETTWSSIDAGANHTLAIKSDGTLWGWGNSNNGQLGTGLYTSYLEPIQIGIETAWTQATGGSAYTIAIKNNGILLGWGNNNYGQLGDGTIQQSNLPKIIYDPQQEGEIISNFTTVSAGDNHTIALKSNGTLWAWGRNDFGQLGDGTTTTRTAAVQIGSDTIWSNIAAGTYHTTALKRDGTLWTWGRNANGQIGDGTNITRTEPVQIGSDTTWSTISSGYSHTIALKSNGTLWAWGDNVVGQLGDGSTIDSSIPIQIGSSEWNAISAGDYHNIALKNDGTLLAWGSNVYGQIGDGTTTDRTTPVQVGSETMWIAISAGGAHTIALKSNGTLWAWGNNYEGKLGDATTITRTAPVQIGNDTIWSTIVAGGSHTSALKSDGTLWAWGSNQYGQLGFSGGIAYRTAPGQVGSETTWNTISTGQLYTAAIKSDSTFWVWGNNNYGQLGSLAGTDQFTPRILRESVDFIMLFNTAPLETKNIGTTLAEGATKTITSIMLDYDDDSSPDTAITYTITSNVSKGAVKLSGTTLALNETFTQDDINNNRVTYVHDGSNSTGDTLGFKVTDGDGAETTGQVFNITINLDTDRDGIIDNLDEDDDNDGMSDVYENEYGLEPLDASDAALDMDGDMYTNLEEYRAGTDPTDPADIPILVDSVKIDISAGLSHTIALKDDGTLLAWGDNTYGQLGLGDTTNRTSPTAILGENNITAVEAGIYFSFALKSDGTLLAWGDNFKRQLGLGDTTNRTVPTAIPDINDIVDIGIGSSFSVALKVDGTLKSWGTNSYGELGLGNTAYNTTINTIPDVRNVKAISVGQQHTIALKKDGTLLAWGRNSSGELGLGDTTDRTTPTAIPGVSNIIAISAGNYSTIALKDDGTLLAWGDNNDGELGLGAGSIYIHKTPKVVTGIDNIVAISTGLDITMVLKVDGTVLICGQNDYGLGLGSDTTYSDTLIPIPAVSDVMAISTGHDYSMVLKVDGTLLAWGKNNNGQLGNGSTSTELVPVTIYDALQEVPIRLINTAPIQVVNLGLTLDEGSTSVITTAKLDFNDDSSADIDITYTISTDPLHGAIQLNDINLSEGSFTQDDINNSRVTYVHDGSDTLFDSFEFNVSDNEGATSFSKTFNITVNPIDDTPPTGYSVKFDLSDINVSQTGTASFTLSYTEAGTTYDYTVSSSRGGSNVIGSGDISEVNQTVMLDNLSGLFDGTLTVSVTLTDSADNTGITVIHTTVLNAVTEGISVSVTDDSTSEASSDNNATFSVSLKSQPEHDVDITLESNNMTEGVTVIPVSNILSFTPANWNIEQYVTVVGVDDSQKDGDIAYGIDLNASSSDSEYNAKNTQVNLINSDDEETVNSALIMYLLN